MIYAQPKIILPPMLHGLETEADRIFFRHFTTRLSAVLVVEGSKNDAIKYLLLPMTWRDTGLMHSILALSGASIDYEEPYGKSLLDMHPKCTVGELQERSLFHRSEAVEALIENRIPAVRYAQMLCLIIQDIIEGRATGDHRIHLQAYMCFIQESTSEEGPFMEFIKEFFSFHIAADKIISLPQARPPLSGPTELSDLGSIQGVLSSYIHRITKIRNIVRANMEHGFDPVVDYVSLYEAAEIDAGIREWIPSGYEGQTCHLVGWLYKQALRVYLWRTLFPPKAVNWKPDPRITQTVDDSLSLLTEVGPDNSNQNLLLLPTFIIGCAAFKPEQREPIRIAIQKIKAYTGFRNSDPALKVLEQIWSYMDEKDERSWDWQRVAADIGIDVLVTSGVAFPFGSSRPAGFDDKQPHYPGKPVLKEEEDIKNSERIISYWTMGSPGFTSAWVGQQQILDIKRKTPERDVLSTKLENKPLGKTSPYPSQSQDDASEGCCDTGSEFSEDEYQSAGMICTDFLVSGITERERKFFVDASRAFWNIWNRDSLLIISKCVGQITPHACSGSSSNYVTQYQSGPAPTTSSNASNPMRPVDKRKRSDDEPQEDDRGQGPKRPIVDVSPPDDDSSTARFACPFRKHDPRKYNMHHDQGKWQNCAISSWPTVARVK